MQYLNPERALDDNNNLSRTNQALIGRLQLIRNYETNLSVSEPNKLKKFKIFVSCLAATSFGF